MAMHFHYGPTGKPTTAYGAPLRGGFDAMRTRPIGAFDAMRTRPVPQAGVGENYVYDAMRTRPIARGGVGDISSTVSSGMSSVLKTALEFGAGFVLGSALAPTAKDKTVYGVGGGLTAMLFGVVGLGVGALALAQMKK
jgi:hypothetical protein